MKDRKDLNRDIEKLVSQQTLLQDELNRLVGQELAAMQKLGESVLSGDGGVLPGSLVELRLRKEAVILSLDLARQRIRESKEELSSLERAEKGGQWPGIDRDLDARLARIRSLTGEDGLKGELAGLYEVLLNAEKVAPFASQEAQIKATRLIYLHSEISKFVVVVQNQLDSISRSG